MSGLNCSLCDKELPTTGFMHCNTCHCLNACMECYFTPDNVLVAEHAKHQVIPVTPEHYKAVMKQESMPKKSENSAFEAVAEQMYKDFLRRNPTIPCCTAVFCAHLCTQCTESLRECVCKKRKFMKEITREQVATFMSKPAKEESKHMEAEKRRALQEEMYAEYVKKRGPLIGTCAMCPRCGAGGSLSCTCPCFTCKYPKTLCVCAKNRFIAALTQQQIEEFANTKKAIKISELEKKKRQAQKDLEDAQKELNSI